MDQNIKEITEKVEGKLQAELGGEILKFKSRGQYEKQLSTERKSELVARARKIINADQLTELNGIIDILSSHDIREGMKKYYLLIDGLDDRWVDVSVRFRLIRALLESLKTFRKITNLKVLVALRSDILERVVQETRDITFQREKFEGYFVHLKWNRSDLKALVDKRIVFLFRRQYTQADIYFEDIFTQKVGNQEAFEYIIERTLMRPRDAIAFVNECLEMAQGHYEVTATMIRKAELEYSRIRREALEQEWQSAFPTIRNLLNFVASFKKALIDVEELLDKDRVDSLAYDIGSESKVDHDPLYAIAREHLEKGAEPIRFVGHVISALYRVNAIGVKLQPSDKYLYSHSDQPLLSADHPSSLSRIRIHPMLWGALRIQ
jgi:hypothetical protein